MTFVTSTILFVVLFFIEIIYFKIADHYGVIDQPNHRSSHSVITIRGGGVIFGLAAILFYFIFNFQYPYFMLGLFLISAVSLVDDVRQLNNKVRLGIHLAAVLLLFYQLQLFSLPWYWLVFAGVFIIGTINAYNFMDGINGITGSYSLLIIATLYFINERMVNFTSSNLLITIGLSLLVFNFFNFRTMAKCFAGDVGSVSMAFILVFLIGQLLLKTHNFAYILLLLIYGLDTAVTVFFRKIRKENIFEAHRSHFYQYLANQLKYPHLAVSSLYFAVQLFVNIAVLFVIRNNNLLALIFFFAFVVVFLVIRFLVEGQEYLLRPHK